VIRFGQRRFFPERWYRLPLRWVRWGVAVLLVLVLLPFMKLFK